MPRELTYVIGASIDGFIADADGDPGGIPVRPPTVEFLVDELPETLPGHVRAALGVDVPNRRFDTVVMGRATYEPGPAAGFPSPYPHLRQHVVSTTLRDPHPDVHVVAGDPVAHARALLEEDGLGVYLAGGGVLAAALAPLIDELIIKTYPLVLGTGVPMFAGGGLPDLRLESARPLDDGMVVTTYRRA